MTGMRPTVNATLHTRTDLGSPPTHVADVVLIDAGKAAAIGDMSKSWWYAEVAAGRAPQPAVRMPRCTRWRERDVLAFWLRFSERGDDSRVIAQATKASRAARAARGCAQ
jgi:predicted DNA-binding transcriptional regulator AlpA